MLYRCDGQAGRRAGGQQAGRDESRPYESAEVDEQLSSSPPGSNATGRQAGRAWSITPSSSLPKICYRQYATHRRGVIHHTLSTCASCCTGVTGRQADGQAGSRQGVMNHAPTRWRWKRSGHCKVGLGHCKLPIRLKQHNQSVVFYHAGI